MQQFKGIKVFRRIRHSSSNCLSCGKPLVRLVKLSSLGIETQNFMDICINKKCPQKANVALLEKSGWRLYKNKF